MKRIRKKHNPRIIMITVIIIYIIFSLTTFYNSVNEKKETMNVVALQDLANQSAAILNEQIEYSFDFLQSMAYLSEDYSMDDPALIEELKHFTFESDFQRFGVADRDGNTILTNGKKTNISDRDFFKKSISGQKVFSDNLDSKVINEDIIVCSVPLKEKNGSIRGVLYGVLNREKLVVFSKSVIENDHYYMHVIDGDGHYIYFSSSEKNLVQNKNNFFEGLTELNINIPIDDIKSKMASEEKFIVNVSRGDDCRLVYFSNLAHSNWYAISVVDKAYVTLAVDVLLKQDVLVLSINILGSLVLLGFVIFYYQNKEKKYIHKLNNKLARNELIYKTAAFSEDKIVFVYDMRQDQLEFISGDLQLFTLNKVIYNATDTIFNQFDHSGNLESIIQKMKERMSAEETTFEDEIEVIIAGKKRYYHLYASSIFGVDGNVETVVGNIRDTTSEKENLKSLRKQAEIDSLTGTYNREGGIKKIKESLKKEGHHALLLLDIDYFKELNDTLGHQYGDRALAEVGEILMNYFRKNDIICRLGGDEFIVFIENINKDVSIRIIDTLTKRLNLVYQYGDNVAHISASIGLTIIPQDGILFDELYEKADQALYRAKFLGKNRYCLYEEGVKSEK